MNSMIEVFKCPNCGASIDFLPSEMSNFQCEYCGSVIHLANEPQQNINVNIADELCHITPNQVIQRVGRLFYLCKDEHAKILLEKALIYRPNNAKLLELENQCDCFLTRDFGNYIKMLSVRSFLTKDESERYRTEIDGFCKMVGNKAINALSIPMQRRQNTQNYEAILKYIAELKKCLQNDVVIKSEKLYESVRMAVLKLTAIVCNTIYIKNTRVPRKYIMLIDFQYRRKLKSDFDAINMLNETEYKIVDESVIKMYIPGGRYE